MVRVTRNLCESTEICWYSAQQPRSCHAAHRETSVQSPKNVCVLSAMFLNRFHRLGDDSSAWNRVCSYFRKYGRKRFWSCVISWTILLSESDILHGESTNFLSKFAGYSWGTCTATANVYQRIHDLLYLCCPRFAYCRTAGLQNNVSYLWQELYVIVMYR